MGVKKQPRILRCRFCGDEIDATNRDVVSGWTHSHSAVCPHRQDFMPALNGVHVGDVWRNLHTKEERTVTALRLGGDGVYTDREPVVQLGERGGMGGWPMWSLVEHWEPISRPGSYPVPWTRSKRFRGRSAHKKWRTGGIRKATKNRTDAYYHSYLYSDGPFSSGGWGQPWQIDPAMQHWESVRRDALELLESDNETLVKVGEVMLATIPQAA